MKTSPLSRRQVREVDRVAIEELGMPGIVLMENAGRGCVELMVRDRIPERAAVFCGKGNNAGDGLVIARHLSLLGCQATVFLAYAPEDFSGDAAANFRIWRAGGGLSTELRDMAELPCDGDLSPLDWVIDALLGTGAAGPLRPPLSQLLPQLNRLPARKLAVDLPTGLDCDTGLPQPSTFRADITATLVAPKIGFSNPAAAHYLGEVKVVGIGVPSIAIERAEG